MAPLSVAGTLRQFLYEDRTIVATSATLALGGNFDTVARSLGLTLPGSKSTVDLLAADAEAVADEPPPWRSLDVGSPFDYGKQGILYVAAHLPRPAESGLPEPAARELVRLVRALGGRTLGLFSSRRAATRSETRADGSSPPANLTSDPSWRNCACSTRSSNPSRWT